MFAAVRNVALGVAALGLCAGVAVPTQAAYIVSLQEVGANVVATGSGGSLNLADLSWSGSATTAGELSSISGYVSVGVPTDLVDVYIGIVGPSNLGSGGSTSFGSGAGPAVAIWGAVGILEVPTGYVGKSLGKNSSDTWTGATFASLGVTPGTYVWTWGTGADADSFTLQIGPVAAAPEPASLTLLAVGLAGLGMVLQTRRV